MRIPAFMTAVAVLAACGDPQEEAAPVPESAAAVRDAVVPATVDRAQIAQLRWLEGNWRGTGDGVPAFFERYTFPNDSTMVSATYADSTMTAVSDSSLYMLRDSQFSNGRYVLVSMSADSAAFAPLASGSNSFVWKRVSPDEWTAVLTMSGASSPSRVYTLKRAR